MNESKNVLVLCSAPHSLINFRGDFIKSLIKNDYNVFCGGPDLPSEIVDSIKKLGGIPIEYHLERTGLNPLKDLKTMRQLREILERHKIDILFPYTIKPVIYGSFAAKQTNVPVISLITGLGLTFSKSSLKSRLLQLVTERLYRRALRFNEAVIFQNIDDLELFKSKKIIHHTNSLHVVNGSGINLNRFPFRANNKAKSDAVKFVIVGRLIKEKGVELFMRAAAELKSKFPLAEFHIIGTPPENASSAVSLLELQKFDADKTIVYHGSSNRVGQLIAKTDVFVLPSFYREGVPRSILEALSIGMPIITTNQPGCRETVIESENGFLINPNEYEPLLQAMTYFLENPEEIEHMSNQSRKLAEEKFDVDIINEQLVDIINNHSK